MRAHTPQFCFFGELGLMQKGKTRILGLFATIKSMMKPGLPGFTKQILIDLLVHTLLAQNFTCQGNSALPTLGA